ncbi:MAG: mannose-1-phosphate guanylyltransferase [Saprospiraceae bacterium]|nr:mannose-1-phosphate guanylyltransferase [Saprospiraceae bacterium]
MEKYSVYSVIMAGGIGSRFWPLSRNNKPKQFLDILGTGRTLLQMTWDRLLQISDKDKIIVVTHIDYKDLVQQQLPLIKSENILLEPERKNTAPCVLYAALYIQSLDDNALMFVAPADHLILQQKNFYNDVIEGVAFIKNNPCILTLGIEVSRPDTGYGYIEYLDGMEQSNDIYSVTRFVEKPSREVALTYMNSGNYVWNSGMFLWTISTILEAYKTYASELFNIFHKYGLNKVLEAYKLCQNISVDYAILEHYPSIFVKRVDFGWSDLGTWGSVYNLINQDEHSNAILNGNNLINDTTGCMVYNNTDQVIATFGIQDLIIINTNDAILILPKSEEQSVKFILDNIRTEFGDKFI